MIFHQQNLHSNESQVQYFDMPWLLFLTTKEARSKLSPKLNIKHKIFFNKYIEA